MYKKNNPFIEVEKFTRIHTRTYRPVGSFSANSPLTSSFKEPKSISTKTTQKPPIKTRKKNLSKQLNWIRRGRSRIEEKKQFFRESFTSNRIRIKRATESEFEHKTHFRFLLWFQFLAISNRFPHHTRPKSIHIAITHIFCVSIISLDQSLKKP